MKTFLIVFGILIMFSITILMAGNEVNCPQPCAPEPYEPMEHVYP